MWKFFCVCFFFARSLRSDITLHHAVSSYLADVSLTISVASKSLDVSVTMPLTYQNMTRGLMGNFNGQPDDDFVLPDGTILASNLTERQIFETFGKQCKCFVAVCTVQLVSVASDSSLHG